MTLKIKVSLILLCVFTIFGAVIYGIQQLIIYPSFLSLESDESIKNVKRSLQAINREIHHLDLLCSDWAAWDDTYNFIESLSDKYISANLLLTTFTANKINTIYYVDINGKVIWGESHDLETEDVIRFTEFTKDTFPVNHPFITYKTKNNSLEDLKNTGVFMTEKGPMLISSRPILTSSCGGPARGFLIFGRLLNNEIIKTLIEQTQVDFEVFSNVGQGFSGPLKNIVNRITDESRYLTEISNNDYINSYTIFSDITGDVTFLIKSNTQRKISKKGNITIRYAMIILFITGFIVLVVIYSLLRLFIVKPITSLTNRIVLLKKNNDLSTNIPTERKDELGILEIEFSIMLEQLQKTQTDLELEVTNRTAELTITNTRIFQEIKERKHAEQEALESQEKLARSKTMESLGILAGGVAHDLNNILSGIINYPELLLLNMPEDSPYRKPIEKIKKSGHRAAAIVEDLLTIARGVATPKKPINLNDLVEDYLVSPELFKLKELFPAVTIKTNFDKDLLNLNGSHIHIRKIIMNLTLNAFEATDNTGNVIISTMNRYVDKPLKRYDDVHIGEYIILSISDDGFGISPSDLERIFEPFYTKKVIGRSGTGLGLTVVWNTIQDHNGYIDVTSGESGTTFELYFPITRKEISGNESLIPIKEYIGNQETILVIDDEENQREISCDMLNTLCYKAKSVSSGEEAVEYMKEHSVDLLLLDMIMDPGIDGRETYEKIIEFHPGQKAVIVSGFAKTKEVKAIQKLGAGKYVKKPVTLETIGTAIKEELEKIAT